MFFVFLKTIHKNNFQKQKLSILFPILLTEEGRKRLEVISLNLKY